MLKCHEVIPAGTFEPADAADRVVLDLEDRRRRRLSIAGEGGLAFLLDLAEVPALREGDGLRLTDGRIVAVAAAPERLAEISARDAAHLVRIAWHLGNRHLPTELKGEKLRIRHDHVIEAMVEGLGGAVAHVTAPFEPEGGAYGHGPVHAHDHGHARRTSHGGH